MPVFDVSRRAFCIGAGSAAALLGVGALRFLPNAPEVRPPGGQDEAHLFSACIRCQKCYEVCPRNVVVPAGLEGGVFGVRAPMLNFDANYCDFCASENGGHPRCADFCPTDALQVDESACKERTVLEFDDTGAEVTRTTVSMPDLGLATITESECLAFRDTGCHFCYDACPLDPKGIELFSEGDAQSYPHVRVIEQNCNGCGACESVCVSLKEGSIVSGATERAIVVRPFEVVEQMRAEGKL